MSARDRAARRGGGDFSPASQKAIRNAYAGTCGCGAPVAPRAGVAIRSGADWQVQCAACFGGDLPRIHPPERNKELRGYWLTFTDGSHGYCQGHGASDAVRIAEHLTGKRAVVGPNEWEPDLPVLPYPAAPIIWQFDHPVNGKCPAFCTSPAKCQGHTSCPQRYACSE